MPAVPDAQGIRHLSFRWAEVFPEEDPLSEWLVTLAVAMNDLTLVHVRMDSDQDEPDRYFYWNRLAISHFTEAGLFLDDTVEVAEVEAFVVSLSAEARANYEECLEVFREQRSLLFDIRNKATFHYPRLQPTDPQAERPIRDSLADLRDDRGVIRSARLRDARALFADDAVAAIFVRLHGGEHAPDRIADALDPIADRLVQGVTAFIRFANLALGEYFQRQSEAGAAIEEVELVDPENPRAGWRLVASSDDGSATQPPP